MSVEIRHIAVALTGASSVTITLPNGLIVNIRGDESCLYISKDGEWDYCWKIIPGEHDCKLEEEELL